MPLIAPRRFTYIVRRFRSWWFFSDISNQARMTIVRAAVAMLRNQIAAPKFTPTRPRNVALSARDSPVRAVCDSTRPSPGATWRLKFSAIDQADVAVGLRKIASRPRVIGSIPAASRPTSYSARAAYRTTVGPLRSRNVPSAAGRPSTTSSVW